MTERRLVVLRHAKADRPPTVADIDRPLSERGHADAVAAGAWLRRHGYRPDLVICSPARRTRQTWQGVAVALAAGDGPAPTVTYPPPVYEGGPEQLLRLVHDAPGEARTILLIGHNPAVSLLSNLLDPGGETDSDGLRTSGIAVHEPVSDWAALAQGKVPRAATHTARGGA